jgi:hypothetical protein
MGRRDFATAPIGGSENQVSPHREKLRFMGGLLLRGNATGGNHVVRNVASRNMAT